MSTVPAVCPNCAQVVQVEADALPDIYTCPHCGAELTHQRNGAIITFSLKRQEPTEREEVTELLLQAETEQDPRKKHDLLQQALALDPDSYRTNLELLLLGDLYQRDKRAGDFRIIKSYLLDIFENPDKHPPAEYQDMLQELLESPQVQRTLALAPDADRFWNDYLVSLSESYISLFIRSRSGVSKFAFGIPRSGKDIAATSATIVRGMMWNISEEKRLEPMQRQLLRQAMRTAYGRLFSGYEALLNKDA